jgi:hypothetical protein
MDPSVKSLTITGSAAEDIARSRLKVAGSRRKRAVLRDEIDEDNEFIEKAKNFNVQNKLIISQPVKPIAQVAQVAQVAQIAQVAQVAPVAKTIQQVIIKPDHTNVILKPLKHPRVKLQPKSIQTQSTVSNPINTRRARKIKININNLTHRFTRAKKVKDDTENKSIDNVRNYLVEKGVIQEKSKAPEKMLRSMYADFMLLKDQAL